MCYNSIAKLNCVKFLLSEVARRSLLFCEPVFIIVVHILEVNEKSSLFGILRIFGKWVQNV